MRAGQKKLRLLRGFCAYGYYFFLISLVTFLIKQESNKKNKLFAEPLLLKENYLRNSCS